MNRNPSLEGTVCCLVIAWSLTEILPPKAGNLVSKFDELASNLDPKFTNIVAKAQELDKATPDRGYQSPLIAIGTNDIRPLFPDQLCSHFRLLKRNERHPGNPESGPAGAAGEFKLGLDLRGDGICPEMDPVRSK